jgi:hypothetical protein
MLVVLLAAIARQATAPTFLLVVLGSVRHYGHRGEPDHLPVPARILRSNQHQGNGPPDGITSRHPKRAAAPESTQGEGTPDVAEELVRALADFGPAAIWLVGAVLGLLAVCLPYLGIVLVAVLHTTEPSQQQYRYQVFHGLVDLIHDICRGRVAR